MIFILTILVGVSLFLIWLYQRELESRIEIQNKLIKGQSRMIKTLLNEKSDELEKARIDFVREADENERW